MKRRNEKKHVIDFLFPLAVFFVLAASSVAIVVLASGFYSRQVKASSDSYSGRRHLPMRRRKCTRMMKMVR